jgi:hypothetical protein
MVSISDEGLEREILTSASAAKTHDSHACNHLISAMGGSRRDMANDANDVASDQEPTPTKKLDQRLASACIFN